MESESIAGEVLLALKSLSHKKDGTKYKSWVHAFRTVWSASKIQEVQSRLQSMRDELQFRILVSIKEDNIHGLDEASRKVLEDIVNSNKTLKADIHTQAHDILAHQKAEGTLATGRHQEVLDAIFSQNVKAPSVDTILQTIQSKLYSHRQDDRFEDIAQAHQKTFTWAFEKQNPSQSGPDLLNWLQSLNGTYWINGKAGSGKSTLMKYLVQDPRFKQALQEWAGDDNLVIATFYFWRSGAPIQRTQTGLLQSLLWQVLKQQPTMGSLLFPEQYVYGAVWTEFPTFHQLRRAFSRFTNHITGSAVVPIKVAFIVDGLDEFEKDVIDFTGLADIFLTSSKSPNVKALVLSRPLPAFESSFEGVPKLHLHELTYTDVTAYVEAELGPRLRFTNSSTHGSNNTTDLLLAEIVNAAAGVFLWVKLVVQSLIEGVENGDTVEDLRTRLEALPRDLEDLFDHMIDNVPDSYKEQSSQIFQLMDQYQHHSIIGRFTAIDLAFALNWNEASVLQAPIAVLPLAEKDMIEKDVDRRLKSRCAGLLELRTRIVKSIKLKDSTILDEKKGKDVVYLHRTVADYLSRPEIWEKILSWTAGAKFNAHRLLLQSFVMGFKIEIYPQTQDYIRSEHPGRRILWPMIENAMVLARYAEETGNVPISALLHEMDRVVALHVAKHPKYQISPDETWHSHFMAKFKKNTAGYSQLPTHDDFLSLMILSGLYHSVADVLSTHTRSVLTKKGMPYLHYICLDTLSRYHVGPHPRMVQLLVEKGADPDQIFDNRSAWQNALELSTNHTQTRRRVLFLFLGALTMFVKHGANPNACIDVDGQRQSVLHVVKMIFGRILQEDPLDKPAYMRSRGFWELDNNSDTQALTHLMLPENKEKLRRAGEMTLDLIKLLESKGAKTKAWRKGERGYVEIGSFRDRSSAFFTGRNWKREKSLVRQQFDWII